MSFNFSGAQEGPGIYRARHGHLKYRMATSTDVKAKTNGFKEAPKKVYQRLRINGFSSHLAYLSTLR